MREPQRKALVEDRIDGAIGDRLQAACVTRSAVQLQSAAPAFQVGERIAVEPEHLVDEIARRMSRVLARRELERDALRLDIGERLDAGARMYREDEAVPRRVVGDDAERQRLAGGGPPAPPHRRT